MNDLHDDEDPMRDYELALRLIVAKAHGQDVEEARITAAAERAGLAEQVEAVYDQLLNQLEHDGTADLVGYAERQLNDMRTRQLEELTGTQPESGERENYQRSPGIPL